ncbi:MAG TPA: FAD-binding oxidoreductase [Jatrophihabitans sp.]|nr:FAD-binding oxidoreductase [Jatrophihabitans sp.]
MASGCAPHPLGWSAHDAAVATLRAAYRSLPPDSPVRLVKPTSNLFRPREQAVSGLDVSGLAGVIAIDPQRRVADVQGMCTYETVVDATLAHGLMPLVVPQLRTITLGGAVTGLGVESSSLFNGLPHESVLEMDVLTGAGEIVTAGPAENADLYTAFPNSYGSLGYAVRLRIALQPVRPFVALRHVPFADAAKLADAIDHIARAGEWEGRDDAFVDGVVFGRDECYLTLGSWSDTGPGSDYTRATPYYRSIKERGEDRLSVRDYLWRWDTDWFWCSAAFGLEKPLVRRLWPRRYRRSDVYHRIVAFENRHGYAAALDRRRGKPPRERVVQDVEVPLERTAEFLDWFAEHVGMSPVWLCPLRAQRSWPLYPLEPGRTYVNVGFWGSVPIADGRADGDVNRAIERVVGELGGHKSLYSDVYYDRDEFDALYGGPTLRKVREQYDPQDRLVSMYDKVVGRR